MQPQHVNLFSELGDMCGPGAGTEAGRQRKQGSAAPKGAVDDDSVDEADPAEDGGEDPGEEEEAEEEGALGEDASEVEEEGTDEGEREDAGAAAEPGSAQRGGGASAALSTHERRLARMAARIARMEEENMGEREWFLRGEAGAGAPLRLLEVSDTQCMAACGRRSFLVILCALAGLGSCAWEAR